MVGSVSSYNGEVTVRGPLAARLMQVLNADARWLDSERVRGVIMIDPDSLDTEHVTAFDFKVDEQLLPRPVQENLVAA